MPETFRPGSVAWGGSRPGVEPLQQVLLHRGAAVVVLAVYRAPVLQGSGDRKPRREKKERLAVEPTPAKSAPKLVVAKAELDGESVSVCGTSAVEVVQRDAAALVELRVVQSSVNYQWPPTLQLKLHADALAALRLVASSPDIVHVSDSRGRSGAKAACATIASQTHCNHVDVYVFCVFLSSACAPAFVYISIYLSPLYRFASVVPSVSRSGSKPLGTTQVESSSKCLQAELIVDTAYVEQHNHP